MIAVWRVHIVVLLGALLVGCAGISSKVASPCIAYNEAGNKKLDEFLCEFGQILKAKKSLAVQIDYLHEVVCGYPQFIGPKLMLVNRYLMDGRVKEASYLAEGVVDQMMSICQVCGKDALRPIEETVPDDLYVVLYRVVKTLEATGRNEEAGRLKWKSDLLVGTLQGDLTMYARRLYEAAEPIQPIKSKTEDADTGSPSTAAKPAK